MIPAVWIPPEPVRQLRGVGLAPSAVDSPTHPGAKSIAECLAKAQFRTPDGELFGPAQREWWNQLKLEPLEQLLVTQDLQLLDDLEPLIEQVEQQLYLESVREPWNQHIPFVIQQTGIGVTTAMILLAAIGDIQRFSRAPQLVGYAGLGARVHDSADKHRGGGITKQGRRDLRGAMVEAAWIAVIHKVIGKSV